jgi:ComF family protein
MTSRLFFLRGVAVAKQIVFPKRCPICDNIVVPYGRLICKTCEESLHFLSDPTCLKCGKSLGNEDTYCYDCLKQNHFFSRGYALFPYELISDSLYRFKYKNRPEYGIYYGNAIAMHFAEVIRKLEPEGIIPVPLHYKKERMRGYNQAQIIAEEIGKILKIKVFENLIERTKYTTPQKELDHVARQNNLKKAFIISESVVKLRSVIIIDDIYTTGSTIDAMAKILQEVGVNNIFFITIAIGKSI